jgi:hypothetical protein
VTDDLLRERPVVVNVGVREFAEAVAEQEVPVVQVDWSPPHEVDADLADLLKDLL